MATNGDLHLAASGDFFMAIGTSQNRLERGIVAGVRPITSYAGPVPEGLTKATSLDGSKILES